MKSKFWRTALGFAAIFFCVAFTATCSVLLYAALSEKIPDNLPVVALATFGNLIVICIIYAAVDKIRRIITIEKPVTDILAATEQITLGNFDVELHPRHPYGREDELDKIMVNITRMSASLKKSELLNSDFIANASHEIKTPLAAIVNCAALIKSGNLNKEELTEYADSLTVSAKRLSDMVGDILKLNKLENGTDIKSDETVNLSALLGECLLQFEDKIETKNLQLNCEIDDVFSVCEKSYYQIVFSNLISNAVKFSNVGGKITVKLKTENDKIIFSVADEGCGFDKDVGERIFDKFYQADRSHSKEGNGLGLPLVKKIIETIGGEINVESKTDEGATFSVITRLKQN